MPALSKGNRTREATFSTEERPVTNAVTVTDGDFVKLASGRVTNATIGTGKLYGVVQGGPSDLLVSRTYRAPTTLGDAAGTKTVIVELCEGQVYDLPITAAADLAADAEGSYYNLTGATGAQVVDNTSKSATVGQLFCVKRIPTNAAGTQFRRGLFTVAAPQSATTPA